MLEFYLVNSAKSGANNNNFSGLNINPEKMVDYLPLEDGDDVVPF